MARLRAALPDAAIAVLGPPDGNQAPPRRARRPAAACTPAPRPDAWFVPPGLAAVRDAQLQVATRNGWLFWDWAAAMGGPCAIDRWARADPPLAWPDHVHLRDAGYEASADALFGVLMRLYASFRAGPPAA